MKGERGAALLIALLVVFLATTFATLLLADRHLFFRRSVNIFFGDQAQLLALSGENWAKTILHTDQKESTTDHLGENWAKRLPPLPIEGGVIQGKLSDAQALFNVNNLVDEEGKENPLWRARFERLLALLNVPTTLASALVDWLDADSDVQPLGGAEDSSYLGANPPHRVPNRRISEVSELRLLFGMEKKYYDALLPYITALPTTTALNVNTANPLVLRAYFPNDPGEIVMENALENREKTPFTTVDDFLRTIPLGNLEPPVLEAIRTGLAVETQYFWLDIEIFLEDARFPMRSLLVRDAQKGPPRTLFCYQPLVF